MQSISKLLDAAMEELHRMAEETPSSVACTCPKTRHGAIVGGFHADNCPVVSAWEAATAKAGIKE